MEKNITIGLIIAFILVICGAFLMHKDSGNGGFLLDFLKNHTENTTTADNSTINETINQTINETATNITENTTNNSTAISFDATAECINNTVLISVDANKENITLDEIAAFISYNNANFTQAVSQNNVTLPTVIEISPEENATVVYYYLELLYNNMTYRIPTEGAYNVTLAVNETTS